MISRFEVWRRTLWLWVVPLAFCAVGLLILAIYMHSFSGRVERLQNQLQASRHSLESYRAQRADGESFLLRVEQQRRQVEELYVRQFRTEEERFTAVIQEVKRLARDAGLEPSNLAYPSSGKSAYDLAGRDINFSVNGTYRQVRTFINFLELSDHFLTLREVTLTGVSDEVRREPTLGINLRVSTYFHRQEQLLFDGEDQAEVPAS